MASRLIFACSGAADVGGLSDYAARKLSRENYGKMYCLAGVGADIEPMVETARAADKILVIDGCDIACAKKCLEARGIEGFDYMQVTELGLEKGRSPASNKNVETIVEAVRKILSD